jgi:hypothetical protein
MTVPRALLVAACLAAGACGSSSPSAPSSTPSPAPAAPPPSTTSGSGSVTVAAEPFMFSGAQQTATVSARFVDGRTGTPAGQWVSGNTDVARVGADGRVTAVASGDTTISFTTSDGVRGSAPVSVRPDMRGTWKGGFTVRSCEEQGLLSEVKVCSLYPVGSTYYIGAVLDQTRASLTGYVDIIDDHRSDDIHFEIPADGILRLDLTAADVPFRFRMQWEAGTRTTGLIDGDLKVLIRVDGIIGEATLKTVFREFRRIGDGTRAPL